ncbi:MAG: tetratricopeptide repeat protein [Sandaracinaceae bacterium]
MRDITMGAVSCAMVWLLAVAAAAQSDDEAARTHFDAGLLHYQEGAYDRALVEFERAWELSHRPELLVNLATVRERLNEHARAAEDLREYVRLRPEDPERPRLERRIANLERLASGGSEVPEDEAQEAEAIGGGLPQAPSGGGSISPVGPILLGVGGAALIAAAIVGGAAVAQSDSVRSMCSGGVCPGDLRDDADGVESLAIATDVLWVSGLLIAGTGLVLTLVLTEGGDDTAATAPSVRLAVRPGGLALTGAF